jgi:hypothetical protein
VTCVIAVPDGNIIHLAADRAVSGEGVPYQEGARKIDRFPSGLIVGFAGSYAGVASIRIGGLGDHRALAECDPASEQALQRLSAFLRRRGALTAVAQFRVELLLAMRGTLVYMDSLKPDWGVTTGPLALGIGGPIALRSWLETPKLPVRERLGRAIGAAAEYAPEQVSRAYDYEQTTRSVGGPGMTLTKALEREAVTDYCEIVVGSHAGTKYWARIGIANYGITSEEYRDALGRGCWREQTFHRGAASLLYQFRVVDSFIGGMIRVSYRGEWLTMQKYAPPQGNFPGFVYDTMVALGQALREWSESSPAVEELPSFLRKRG